MMCLEAVRHFAGLRAWFSAGKGWSVHSGSGTGVSVPGLEPTSEGIEERGIDRGMGVVRAVPVCFEEERSEHKS